MILGRNILWSLVFYAGSVPIVLTSRADSLRSRLASVALAALARAPVH